MYGVDTISCGATIAFAMECFEKGIIGLDQTEGSTSVLAMPKQCLLPWSRSSQSGTIRDSVVSGLGSRRPSLG